MPLTYTIASQPAYGLAIATTPPYVEYASTNQYYIGLDTFTYTVSNGRTTSAPGTVYVTLNKVPKQPFATNVSATMDENTTATIGLLGFDVNGDPLTYSVYYPPDHGDVTITDSNAFYTPYPNYVGSDQFVYMVDNGTYQESAVVQISVNAANRPPVATPDSVTLLSGQSAQIQALDNDYDLGRRLAVDRRRHSGNQRLGHVHRQRRDLHPRRVSHHE